MIQFARPNPSEERWLAVASALGTKVATGELAARTGGWRSTGVLARIAMFFLGLLAVGLFAGILSLGGTMTMLISGLAAAFAAETLARGKRLFASGIEEGLCLGGWLLLGGWVLTLFDSSNLFFSDTLVPLVLIGAAGAAGLRLLNPFITTVAVIAFVRWAGSQLGGWPPFSSLGPGIVSLVIGVTLTGIALWWGRRTFERPSHDRLLDWLVASLPLLSHSSATMWAAFDPVYASSFIAGRWLSVILLAVLAVVLLVTGVRRRRHAPLIGSMGCVVAIAIELRVLMAVSTETWLIAGGLLALLLGIALDRYLREPRDGLTSKPLSKGEGPLDILQTAGAAVLTHGSNAAAPRPEPELTGGGGRFGGGGASGSY